MISDKKRCEFLFTNPVTTTIKENNDGLMFALSSNEYLGLRVHSA